MTPPSITALNCPVCSAPIDQNAVRCGYCGSFVVIAVEQVAIDPKSIDRDNINHHIAKFRDSLRSDPHDARGHYGLGLAYYTIGLKQDAADSLERAGQLTPENVSLQVQMAVVYADLVDEGHASAETKAMDRAKRALVLDRGNVDAQLILARLALHAKNEVEFVSRLREAHRSDRDAIRDPASSFLKLHRDILANFSEFHQKKKNTKDPNGTSVRFSPKLQAIAIIFVSLLICVIAGNLLPDSADASDPSASSGAQTLAAVLFFADFALGGLGVYRLFRVTRGERGALKKKNSVALMEAMQPYIDGTIAETERLLGAVDFVVTERVRLAQEAALAAQRAAAQAQTAAERRQAEMIAKAVKKRR